MTEMNKKKSKKKDGFGRPPIDIDLNIVKKLCEIQCTGEEIASVLGINYETLLERIKEEGYNTFPEYFKKHCGKGKASLRRYQWKNAEKGNAAMQIWLGKQYLDQKEKPDDLDYDTLLHITRSVKRIENKT